jgi:NAD(P)-dependent dehydrogenase (short-subunit alcohol dehydrogenase family)
MDGVPGGGLALVIGAGGIGAALAALLSRDDGFARVAGLSRRSEPAVDVTAETSIAAAAQWTAGIGLPLRLVIVTTGFLHEGQRNIMPEKSLAALNGEQMAHAFAVNSIGPALVMKHFLPLLARPGKAVFAVLSAKVGSIGDNATGGWHSYRASKAALNQFLRGAAIETRRRAPEAVCVALHPGTVDTPLSAPFAKAGLNVRPAAAAAAEMLAVLGRLSAGQSGGFFDYTGAALPW